MGNILFMTINSLDTSEFSHPIPETNKKLQEVISKVLALLEGNEELQNTFKNEFRSVFDTVTKDQVKLDKLLTAIDTKLTEDLANLHDRFKNDPNLKTEEAKKIAISIIHKYTRMEQFALANSINPSNN